MTRITNSSDGSIRQPPQGHDSQIDLSEKGETVYRDKGYFGTVPFASIDKTMKRAVRGRELSEKDKRRNRAISRTRSLVERPFAVIKRVFHAGHLMVTTHLRAHVKILSPASATTFSTSSLSELLSGCSPFPLKKTKNGIRDTGDLNFFAGTSPDCFRIPWYLRKNPKVIHYSPINVRFVDRGYIRSRIIFYFY